MGIVENTILARVFLPVALAVIMLSLGLGLRYTDFKRILFLPKLMVVGMFLQTVLVPLLAFTLTVIFQLDPVMTFGVMVLSFCPGGVSSCLLTKLAYGNIALSITLTALGSIITIFTLPIMSIWAAEIWLPEFADKDDARRLAMRVLFITAVPVAIGVLIREMVPYFAQRFERVMSFISVIVFIAVIGVAIAGNGAILMEHVVSLGAMTATMIVALLIIGFSVAKFLGHNTKDSISVSIETSIQNVTMGIAVSAMIAGMQNDLGTIAPSVVYGVMMLGITIPLIFVLRGPLQQLT